MILTTIVVVNRPMIQVAVPQLKLMSKSSWLAVASWQQQVVEQMTAPNYTPVVHLCIAMEHIA
jgi:hypothetical protein